VIDQRHRLVDDDLAAVAALAAAAHDADGVGPLSEQGMLRLHAGAPTRHLVASADDQIVGYAQLDGDSGAAELVVHPGHRRRGFGRRLLAQLLAEAGQSQLKVWAHGDLPAARSLAATTGFEPVRSLWQMSRLLTDDVPDPQIREDVVIDTFVPGADDEQWVALNALAFTGHPEQGALTLSDLHERMAEPWFDPAGFFVARRGPSMVGFHWTKVHDTTTGEVYVLGIDPAERGHGLGKALTVVGMRHLRHIGLTRVILYVDESNQSAVQLYRGLGFERTGLDVMYARPSS
jgi:mycothiol synthase